MPASPWVDAAAGGNALLRDGAGVVTAPGDVLVALGIDPAAAAADDRASASARRPRGCWPRSAARPARRRRSAPGSRSGPAPLQALIAELELAGAVVRESDGSLVDV